MGVAKIQNEIPLNKIPLITTTIDLLLREAMETQVNIEHLTNNRRDIWPHEAPQENTLFRTYEQAEKYAEKERIFDTRYRHEIDERVANSSSYGWNCL